ncbi:MAG: CDP-alcohol phosphatidyltransferase family protein [Magnetococcales bacterium]|nr:CDP-alcohol phosphatidyltransferase family protein [Magnetococcales bacterium]
MTPMLKGKAASDPAPKFSLRNLDDFSDQYLFRPVAHGLVHGALKHLPISPNQVSLISLVTGLLAAWCVVRQAPVAFSVLLILSILLDCADGQLARAVNRCTFVGGMLDHIFDDVKIMAMASAFFWIYRPDIEGAISCIACAVAFVGSASLIATSFYFVDQHAMFRRLLPQSPLALEAEDARIFLQHTGSFAWSMLAQYYRQRQLSLKHIGRVVSPKRGAWNPLVFHNNLFLMRYHLHQSTPLALWRISGPSSLALILAGIVLIEGFHAVPLFLAIWTSTMLVVGVVLQRRADVALGSAPGMMALSPNLEEKAVATELFGGDSRE